MSSSRREQRQAALSKFKVAKASGLSSLDLVDDDVDADANREDDIYDIVDEEEYQRLVESRRQREDFVVDDDGLGYYDDGEEHLWSEADHDEDDGNGKKRRHHGNNNSNAVLTKQALKRARLHHQAATAAAAAATGDSHNADGTAPRKTTTMWDYLNRGTVASAAAAVVASTATSMERSTSSHQIRGRVNVDDLLAQLDDPDLATTTRSRSSHGRRRRRRRSLDGNGHRFPVERAVLMSNDWNEEATLPRQDDDNNNSNNDNYNDTHDHQDSHDYQFCNDDHNDDFNTIPQQEPEASDDDKPEESSAIPTMQPPSDGSDNKTTTPTSVKTVRFAPEVLLSGSSNARASEDATSVDMSSSAGKLTAGTTASEAVPARRRVARPRLQGPSIAATANNNITSSNNSTDSAAPAAPDVPMLTSLDAIPVASMLQADMTLSMADAAASTAGQLNLHQVLQQPASLNPSDKHIEISAATDSWVDMFWMDLHEQRNGDILLFGKVVMPTNNDLSNNQAIDKTQYVSACVLVKGNMRNLFVLPRDTLDPSGANNIDATDDVAADSNRTVMMQIQGEINDLLHQQNILPRKAGVSWAGKPVKRRYAFDDPTLPRHATQYLKVVYDAQYPPPGAAACANGGQHFSRILNANVPLRETFLIKRKLMGPCWVRIYQPTKIEHGPISWCKVEMQVNSPKRIVRWDLAPTTSAVESLPSTVVTPPPPPPLTTVSIKFKTVVHPKTHKSEIVSLSAICHKQVWLESATDATSTTASKHMMQLSLVRPLGLAFEAPHFPRDFEAAVAAHMPQLKAQPNERALLSCFLAQLGQWDPDVLVGHNAWGYDLEVILSRCVDHGLGTAWSKLGRRRVKALPSKSHLSSRRDWTIAEAVAGRLLCDTYLSAKELLRETTYSLTQLAETQLHATRQVVEAVDLPQWFQSGSTLVQLARSTLWDADLVQRLLFKLQILPLTKQLTCIAGNLWSHTLKSNRAERTEYLLLHEFHRLKYLPPERKRPLTSCNRSSKRDSNKTKESHEDETAVAAAPTTNTNNNKAKYAGGLVLEPKKGLYDSYILLLDFNSLYPSIIQEYNLCFTTMDDWAQYQPQHQLEQPSLEATTDEPILMDQLPPLPDTMAQCGVLPRVIRSLVERRRAVKNLLKNEKNLEKKQELDIRQQALKLTANSMYGCLGFSNSRFFAQPIAAMVTAMGRDILLRTVDIAQTQIGLDVIYGDTDSIMINTRISDEKSLQEVYQIGETVKREVNRLYKTLELEIDGVFRTMLLLKKKKYAAKKVERLPDGTIRYSQEMKGLDLVRRDWCVQSKDTGRFVTEQILSGQDRELVIQSIHKHLEEIAHKMRNSELPLEKYVITKGLSKHPDEYPDAKSQLHVQVAKRMLQNDRPVNTGDRIPYIITMPLQPSVSEEGAVHAKATALLSDRAYHPEEIQRSAGVLKPDVEWYLAQQILPSVTRLCEPMEETSQQALAERLGLDTTRFHGPRGGNNHHLDDEITMNFTPKSFLSDVDRFKDVEKLRLYCLSCHEENILPGVFSVHEDNETGTPTIESGLTCTNPNCVRPMFWGHKNHFECYARIANTMSIWLRGLMSSYYEGTMKCDEPSCGLETRQLSVVGAVCLRRGCSGRMVSLESEQCIQTHLKYLDYLFDFEHACEQLEKKNKSFGLKEDLIKSIPASDKATFNELRKHANKSLEGCAFNWITPEFWNGLFSFASRQ